MRDLPLDFMVFGTVVGIILYVIWICLLTVGASNGVNVTDGLDGLAGGASILAIGSFVIIGFWQFNQSCFSENLNPSDVVPLLRRARPARHRDRGDRDRRAASSASSGGTPTPRTSTWATPVRSPSAAPSPRSAS